jgi:mannonate dehydratase
MIYGFEQSMRWYGPKDTVSLQDIRQSGCTAVVSSLHHIPTGEVWSTDQILAYKKTIEEAGLAWHVVESVNVHEDIKRRTGNYLQYIENYKATLRNLGQCGIDVVTYNFMPVLDWVRTDLSYTLADGSKAMYFDRLAFLAFDVFVLQRPGARQELTDEEFARVQQRYATMTGEEKERILGVILSGIPGEGKAFTVGYVLEQLAKYRDFDADRMRRHLVLFLQQVVPVAEQAGVNLAIHPDDPPFPILGLPRIASCEQDYAALAQAVPSTANGICFCTGSLSVRRSNDLVKMSRRFAERIHFVHLRSTQWLDDNRFYEANHLEGSVDMFGVMHSFVETMQKRQISLPLRPDHGHQMLDDLAKPQLFYGYSLLGRMKGLAELRGLEMGIAKSLFPKG